MLPLAQQITTIEDLKKNIFGRWVDESPHIGNMPAKATSLTCCLWRNVPRCSVRFTISTQYRKDVEHQLKTARQLGRWRQVHSLLALLAVMDGQSFAEVAVVLRVHEKTVAAWGRLFCGDGLTGAPRQQPTGRPPKRTPTQTEALAPLIDEGPVRAGFSGACGRAPLIPQVIYDRFGVFDNVFSIAPLRKHLGLSYQTAAFVADHLDVAQRTTGCTTTWPHIRRLAQAGKALRRCGEEAACPQWGTLTYTWARRGQPPQVKTAGTRKGDKVLGLIEDFTGRLLYDGQAGRLNSAADMTLLTRVVAHTTPPIVLIQDGAKYHTSAETTAFVAQQTARLQVFQLPTYAPDDNPIEKLWKQSKQHDTHLHDFPTFEALTATVEQARLTFAHAPKDVLALCSLPTELAMVA
jgi:transposase